ncbi:MAG: ParB/RepB/Spo0J family partition protein [Candidatus Scalindua sp.]|nr:ParB/RepB/Spo0J family partition protein [Candidatus Scalindua sp.]
MDINQVFIRDIDISSVGHKRYLSSYGRVLNGVIDSVSKVGLINPVLIKRNTSNTMYTTVCGYQRILAFQELGLKSIAARIVVGLTDVELLLMSLHDNLFSRGFHDIEKAIILKNFQEIGYINKRLLTDIAPLLRIPQNEKLVERYISLLQLEKEVVDSVAKQELELEKAFLLIPLEDSERDCVYNLLYKETRTNVNEAKETLRNLLDLKLIKQTAIPELFMTKEIRDILQDKRRNKRQKGESLYRLIKHMRYPTISRKEAEFAQSIKELGLDNSIRINHAPFFEKDEVQITIKFSDEKNLKNHLERVLSHLRAGSIKNILPEQG